MCTRVLNVFYSYPKHSTTVRTQKEGCSMLYDDVFLEEYQDFP